MLDLFFYSVRDLLLFDPPHVPFYDMLFLSFPLVLRFEPLMPRGSSPRVGATAHSVAESLFISRRSSWIKIVWEYASLSRACHDGLMYKT